MFQCFAPLNRWIVREREGEEREREGEIEITTVCKCFNVLFVQIWRETERERDIYYVSVCVF